MTRQLDSLRAAAQTRSAAHAVEREANAVFMERLRAAHDAGVSMAELGAVCGVTRQWVWRLLQKETGR